MARRLDRAPLTANRKQAFLAELSKHGVAIRAARVASPGHPTGALSTFKDERKRDRKFAAAWDEAIESADGDLLVELHRRAVEGVPTDIRGPNGQVVGQYHRVSDRLLVEKLRSRFPREFAAHTVSEVTARVAAVPIGLDQLSPESQDDLARLLEREQRRALESATDRLPREDEQAR